MQQAAATQETHPVEVKHFSRRFGKKLALDDVSLTVPRGVVFGLVGENGAGKTTLIKHILGLLKSPEGTVRVFGMDPVKDPERVLVRIGYLSEDHDIPQWMRVRELMRYTRSFFPDWDEAYAEELLQRFGLDPSAKIKHLSRGQRAQAGLLTALAHRPDLLLLDEPSSGLDPIVRRDILGAIVRTVADEGRTVLFSSHLLDEVERVADTVAMISKGRLVLSAPVDEIRQTHYRLTLHFEDPQTSAPQLDGALSCDGGGKEWSVVCDGRLEELKASAARLDGRIVEETTPSLEDVFVARVHHRATTQGAA